MTDITQTQLDDLPLNSGVGVIVCNEDGLVALDKPVGAMSHPNSSKDKKRSLLNADYDMEQECYCWTDEQGTPHKAWLINRLDSPTSGVVLMGLNPEISKTIKSEFASHKVSKMYYALVRGVPKKTNGEWADKLTKGVHAGARVVEKARTVPAKSRYQLVTSPPGGFPVSLIKLWPLTGRTHQLRVQCRKHGLPIVGDRTYGSFSFNREVATHAHTKRMMLHSAETSMSYSFKGKLRKFIASSELPEAFKSVMSFRPGINHGRSSPQERAKRAKAKTSSLARRRFKA